MDNPEFYTYFADNREYFVCDKKKRDFPFLESLTKFVYLDIWSLEPLFKKIDKALLDFYREQHFDYQVAVLSTLEVLAKKHIYFEFLRLDWQGRFRYAEQHPEEDIQTILPHKQLSHIPSDVDTIQKQLLHLFEDVLDIDSNKKKSVSDKLPLYLNKEGLYAYKFQPISTTYEPISKGQLTEVLHPTSIYDLIEFSMRECIKREQRMRRCANCGKYFAIPRRNTAEFCTVTLDEQGRTCKEIGAFKRYRQKKSSDEVFKEYRREYKKRFAWIRAGRITAEDFYAWSASAQAKRDECAEGKITLVELKKWLAES